MKADAQTLRAMDFAVPPARPLMGCDCEVYVETIDEQGRAQFVGVEPLMESGDSGYEAVFDTEDVRYCRRGALSAGLSIQATLVARVGGPHGGAAPILRATCEAASVRAVCNIIAEKPTAVALPSLSTFSCVCRPGRRQAASVKLRVARHRDAIVVSSVHIDLPAEDAQYVADWLAMIRRLRN
jgi:hypothetical protein